MNKKTKLGAIVLFALVCASPVQAWDWFGASAQEPVMSTQGGGNGGGHPSIPDPAMSTQGSGAGGGNPSIPDPN